MVAATARQPMQFVSVVVVVVVVVESDV